MQRHDSLHINREMQCRGSRHVVSACDGQRMFEGSLHANRAMQYHGSRHAVSACDAGVDARERAWPSSTRLRKAWRGKFSCVNTIAYTWDLCNVQLLNNSTLKSLRHIPKWVRLVESNEEGKRFRLVCCNRLQRAHSGI